MNANFSSKTDGSMKKQDGTLDFASIEKFLTQNNLPAKMICMKQVHGNLVCRVSKDTETIVGETDGLITDIEGVSLCVVTADCLPILFYDPNKKVIGVAHAGRKGLQKQIIKNIIAKLQSEFESNPKDVKVFIGPSIEEKCYEVGDDVMKEFEETFPDFKNYYSQKDGKFFLDLRNVALQCLTKEGILREHIDISNICTKCNDNFYSYRKGDKDGRFVSAISLV